MAPGGNHTKEGAIKTNQPPYKTIVNRNREGIEPLPASTNKSDQSPKGHRDRSINDEHKLSEINLNQPEPEWHRFCPFQGVGVQNSIKIPLGGLLGYGAAGSPPRPWWSRCFETLHKSFCILARYWRFFGGCFFLSLSVVIADGNAACVLQGGALR